MIDFHTERELHGGIQRLYRFTNGYGASVVRHAFSYGAEEGLWELAVIKFTGEDIYEFDLDYTTPITNDVIGHLDEKEVETLLSQIHSLPQSS